MAYSDGWRLFANDINKLIAAIKQEGVLSGWSVTETSPPSMSVIVAAGSGIVNGAYRKTTTNTTITLDPANSTYPRKDLIIVDSTGTITKVTGTPAAPDPPDATGPTTKSPQPPTIPANSIVLAEIWVPAGATSITNANITDRRVIIDRYRKMKIICVDDYAGTDKEKFDAAIADADSVNGSIILVPNQYSVEGTITVNKSKLYFVGYQGVSKISEASSETPLFNITVDNVAFYGIIFYGKGDGSAVDVCIKQTGTTLKGLKVAFCEFTNATYAIYIEGNHNLITNNHIHDLTGSVNCGIRVLGDRNRIIGNLIENTYDGINVQDSTNYADANIIANNTLNSQTGVAIAVLYGNKNIVHGNVVQNHSGSTGIDISWGASKTVVTSNSIHTTGDYGINADAEEIDIANNLIIQEKSAGDGIGIWVQGGKHCLIHDNIITGSGLGNAIVLSTNAPAYNTVYNNFIDETNSYSIYINNSSCIQNVFFGNHFVFSYALGNQYYKTNALWNHFLDNWGEGEYRLGRSTIIIWDVPDTTVSAGSRVTVKKIPLPACAELLVLGFWGYSNAAAANKCLVELWDSADGQRKWYADLYPSPQYIKIGQPYSLAPLFHTVMTVSTPREYTLQFYNADTVSRTMSATVIIMVILTATM